MPNEEMKTIEEHFRVLEDVCETARDGGRSLEAIRAAFAALTYPHGTTASATLRAPVDFAALRDANVRRQREWDKDEGISLEYRGLELAGEVGEACNVIKKIARERLGIRGSRATTEQLAEELADVIICVDLVAMQFNIPLDRATARKFNATSRKLGLSVLLPEDE